MPGKEDGACAYCLAGITPPALQLQCFSDGKRELNARGRHVVRILRDSLNPSLDSLGSGLGCLGVTGRGARPRARQCRQCRTRFHRSLRQRRLLCSWFDERPAGDSGCNCEESPGSSNRHNGEQGLRHRIWPCLWTRAVRAELMTVSPVRWDGQARARRRDGKLGETRLVLDAWLQAKQVNDCSIAEPSARVERVEG